MGGTCETLTVSDIVAINRRMIAEFGGIFFDGDNNLADPGSLGHVLEEIQGFVFGQELYPSIIEKAAVIGWHIIANHVFHDGNKRTGMEACRLFLDLNGYTMRIDLEVVDVAIAIADSRMHLSQFTQWIAQRTTSQEYN